MAGAEDPLVPVIVSHVVGRQQDNVVAGGIQMAVRTVDHAGLGESHAALGFEVGDDKFVGFAGFGFRRSGILCTQAANQDKDECSRDQPARDSTSHRKDILPNSREILAPTSLRLAHVALGVLRQ